MEDLLMFVQGVKFLTSTNIKMGFHNFTIHPLDRPKMAFSTPEGQFQPIRLPFGWCNSPPIFMRQMHLTHRGMEKAISIYLDNAVVKGGENLREHAMMFCTMAYNDSLRGLVYEAKKAQLFRDNLEFLGFVVDSTGVKPSLKPPIFQMLMMKDHRNLKSLQQTIGSLV